MRLSWCCAGALASCILISNRPCLCRVQPRRWSSLLCSSLLKRLCKLCRCLMAPRLTAASRWKSSRWENMEQMLTYMQHAVVACSENIMQLTFCGFESDHIPYYIHFHIFHPRLVWSNLALLSKKCCRCAENIIFNPLSTVSCKTAWF